MCGYYRNFVKNYSTIASPLTDLTRLDTPWDWSDECEGAFKRLKHALMNHEVLMVPDLQKPFIMTTDASQYSIGAVLAQQDGKKLRPIEYMSKKMPSKKLAKSTYERELYALYKALVHWRHFLLGRFFYLRTDHQTLKWIKTQPALSDALKRWIEVIDQCDFKLEHLKGEYNKVADALSRTADYLGALVSEFGVSNEITQSLVGAYQEDPVTMDIIRKLQAKDKATESEFVMVDGLINLDKARVKRLVVPSSEQLRSLFLGECHDATGHFGYKKTSANLVQRFWWPRMLDDAKKYVETCKEANDRAAAAAKERNRIEQEEEAKRQQEEQDRLRQEEADLQAAAEHQSRQRERLFTRESMIGDETTHWVEMASADEASETDKGLSAVAQISHDLVATCALQQEEILHLQQTVDQMLVRLQALEKQPVAAAAVGPSNLATRVQVLEDDVSNIKRVHQDFRTSQQATNLQLEMQVQAAATVTPATASSRRPPKLDDLPVFCNQSKTDPIPWWRQFTLTLDMHHVLNNYRHACLYHRSGGACQAWLDNILTSHGVAASELHTKLTWQELTDAWHKRFQVEPPDLQAMEKLNKLHQNSLLSQDRITKFQRLASTPDPLAFRGVKHLFIMRSCPALQNALTQIAETLDTSDKLFTTASQIILTNVEARNAGRSSATSSSNQPKPKVACIAATSPTSSTEAATPNKGDVLAAAWDGGRPHNNHGRDKTKTQSTSSPGTGSAADEPWLQYGLSTNCYRTRLKYHEFSDVFETPSGIVPDWPISHEIILEAGAEPPKGCIYRMSEKELTVLRAQLDDLLEKGWIRPSSSPYGASVLFVRKKNKDLRLCIDYRRLNAQTIKNAGPLPRIDDLLERLGGAKYFSKSGYHQISIRPQDRYKTAFKTRYGHFEWVVMPFGLTNAPTTFQAAMTTEFRAMLDRFVLVYLDDILVYSRTLEEHLEHFRRVLETLQSARYKANRDKCEFVQQALEYLGHLVSPEGIRPLADKIQAIQEARAEECDRRTIVPRLGRLLSALHQGLLEDRGQPNLSKLQSEERPFDFDDDARHSFETLKATLLSAEVLHIYNPLLATHVTTDASGYGIGAVLEQHDGTNWHPVEYFSKEVPLVHSIDDARKKELLAFVHTIKRWRHFRWVMDNNPLVFYKSQDTISNTITRWMAFIDQFDFFPDHIPEKSNRFADALSRRPDLCTTVYSTFEIDDDLRESFIRGYQTDPHFRDNGSIGPTFSRTPPAIVSRAKSVGVASHATIVRSTSYTDYQCPLGDGQRLLWISPAPSRSTRPALMGSSRSSTASPSTPCFCLAAITGWELAEVLYTGWIHSKGYPKDIVCDRDTHFLSDFWVALVKRWDSSLKSSSARHPQTDGQMDRAHQTAQVLLRTLIRPDQVDWVERLPDVELAYNSSIHSTIGISPFEFEHGSPISSPLDAILPRTAESHDHLAFLHRMQELLVKARDQMSKTQIRMSRQANRNRLPCPFRAGDRVWVSAAEFNLEQDISRKLLPKWMGPWHILSAVGDDPEGPSFRIAVPPHLPVHTVFHCSKLAPFASTEFNEFPDRRTQDPPSMDGFQGRLYHHREAPWQQRDRVFTSLLLLQPQG
uniref:Integrase catalytic domain-containing protein n=1 Tax=Chara braunii TaxID=69332 RepID=A0A388L9A2_CHABU